MALEQHGVDTPTSLERRSWAVKDSVGRRGRDLEAQDGDSERHCCAPADRRYAAAFNGMPDPVFHLTA